MMDKADREEERRYYCDAERARAYDLRSAESAASMERQRKVAFELRRLVPLGGQVLDIGCGPARMLIAIAHELPGLAFTGIDVSPEMIALGRANVEAAGLADRIDLHLRGAEEIGSLPKGAYQCVMSHGCFSGWLAPERTLLDARALLARGGCIYIRDWRGDAPDNAVRPYLEGAPPEQQARVRSALAASYTPERFQALLQGVARMRLTAFRADPLWMTAVLERDESGPI
jgi:SAM-dependent methyltransferase